MEIIIMFKIIQRIGSQVVISTFNCGYLLAIPFKFKGYHKIWT